MSLTAVVDKDGLAEVFCEAQPAGPGKAGQVFHIKQDPATATQWWEKPDGSHNWLSLGTPGV